eukprot:TRINITY_DN52162_c0_g1_i1.p1 TRINITY_DN52162_c0_g1~~TRINITY_DN52162_c0_g1_i1.p1  ORF type:complete len:169 (-),score=31.84 TRINITY_DN52162_c0_g1_i1:68-574(-)
MYEGKEIWDYLKIVWEKMKTAVENGLENDGVLPGEMKFRRKAGNYKQKASSYSGALQRRCYLYSYALAVSEENASSGEIVTAPTCGSCGTVPAVLYLLHKFNDFSDNKIVKALATAGLIGNLVKYNACLLYTSDAADDTPCVDLGGRRIIKKKKSHIRTHRRTITNQA